MSTLPNSHQRLLRQGYVWVKASDLRPMEWVHLSHAHLRVLQTARIGETIYVRFDADSQPYRWWKHNYRLRVNYPRPTYGKNERGQVEAGPGVQALLRAGMLAGGPNPEPSDVDTDQPSERASHGDRLSALPPTN